jgi:hypothetical protein
MINLPQGGSFSPLLLLAHMRGNHMAYIIQGQQKVAFLNHTKPNSLDYWLRTNFAQDKDTKQAENFVIDELVATGSFVIDINLRCPDSGRRAKGLRLAE